MPLIPAKCTSCGGVLEVDNEKEAAICIYCGSAYITEKAIQNFNNTYNITNNITANNVIIQQSKCEFEIVAGKLVKYLGEEVDIYIPSNVQIIGKRAFFGTNIKSVVMESSVVEVEEEAFQQCKNLERVVLSSRIRKIGGGAFLFCETLNELIIPEGVTYIGGFTGCNSLEYVDLPSSLEIIAQGAFGNCNLREINIPKNVIQIEKWAFAGNKKLTKIYMSSKTLEKGNVDTNMVYSLYEKQECLDILLYVDNTVADTASKWHNVIYGIKYPEASNIEEGFQVFEGKTVQDAINYAVDSLKIDIKDLKYTVIDEGKKGLFGCRLAKIKAYHQ